MMIEREPRDAAAPEMGAPAQPTAALPAEEQEAAESSEREATLVRAVRMLLKALDGCGGDEPDCPHCGPTRAFATNLLESGAQLDERPE